jgi:hypothetical protein
MADIDLQVHTAALQQTPNMMRFMEAQHGGACEAPPATHSVTQAEMAVFKCRDHVMTALNAEDYGAIYLTPNRMLDWSDGEASFSFDVSTHVFSGREWIDLWLTPWEANLALPLDAGLPDLQGPPADFLSIDSAFCTDPTGGGCFVWGNDDGGGSEPDGLARWQNDSSTQRDTFVLTIRQNGTFDFCKPDENLCWAQNELHGLDATQAVVQIGHHSYNPTKDDAGVPGTWHWDNFSFSDSVHFTMIRANERIMVNSGVFTFPQPAPANSYLRFSAVGRVRINGQLVGPQVPTSAAESYNSYFVPVAAGTTRVVYEGQDDDWWVCEGWGCGMKDVSIWAR